MARRRRHPREIAFGFDSFLDVVANVVGIILRLILVAWVGGRSYKADMPKTDLAPVPVLADPAPLPAPTDERQPMLVRHRREIGAQQKALLGKAAERESMRSVVGQLRLDLNALSAKCQAAEKQAASVTEDARRQAKAIHSVNLGEKEPTRTYDQPDIVALRDALIDSILLDMARISEASPLPALGEGKACDFCAARGLCRKDFWSV